MARGFDVTLVKPETTGEVRADAIQAALRPETLLVSVMHVNSETGVRQPIEEIAAVLEDHDAYFHVDAAQGFGKDLNGLRCQRIDLISISSHKVYGPVGVGALAIKRRGLKKPPIAPLSYGGGQERGLRPGTLPVPLIIGFGLAAELALKNSRERKVRCNAIRAKALAALDPLGIRIHADPERTLPHVLNFSVEGVDSEALMIAIKGPGCSFERLSLHIAKLRAESCTRLHGVAGRGNRRSSAPVLVSYDTGCGLAGNCQANRVATLTGSE